MWYNRTGKENAMSEVTLDTQMVARQFDVLQEQLAQLQRLVASQSSPAAAGTPTDHPHIAQTESILSGEPIIKGTRTPVRAVVEHWKFGDSPEEIARKLPHLRLAHIFDALSYYDDHREEIERYIAPNRVPVDD
jgi:uncharacterized protein (DUF433 family)